MNETDAPSTWPDTMLRAYSDMLTVGEVAAVLNLEERNVRDLLSKTDASSVCPG